MLRGRTYLLASLFALLPACHASPVQFSAPADPASTSAIYVVRRGWHIEVGFAAADLQAPLDPVARQFPGVRYLFFGFGDRRYLLSKHRNAPVLLGALWPGRGLILATGLSSPPQDAFGALNVAVLSVTKAQSRDAQDFIRHSLDKPAADADADAVKPAANGPYEGSLFFDATPRYSALHTCNTWAAQLLAAGALPIRSGGVIFAGQLWKQVRRLEQQQSAQLHGGLVPSWHTTVVPEP
ncbi:MAG: DUF2459 domain-containing protein [Steroidobacteraceae bacterium]